jgi:hypothetical protein
VPHESRTTEREREVVAIYASLAGRTHKPSRWRKTQPDTRGAAGTVESDAADEHGSKKRKGQSPEQRELNAFCSRGRDIQSSYEQQGETKS